MILSPVESHCRITQHLGENPAVYAKYGLKGHNGIDFTGPLKGVSVPVHAPFDGVITLAGERGGYGYAVRLRALGPDPSGRWKEAILGHLASFAVREGQTVYQGDKLGMMGGKPGTPGAGHSTALHLHFGLRFLDVNGKVMDEGNGYSGYVELARIGKDGKRTYADTMLFWRKENADMVTFPYGR